ncbi:MAG: hypothetical protein EON54_22140 [Alcaligenaceae bacterium]|nr:MAG: hypothetical protein EON54_22140 [Alcaligenaceae bacterium]
MSARTTCRQNSHEALTLACMHGANAVVVLGACATANQGTGAAAVYGLKALAQLAHDGAELALKAPTVEKMEDASTLYEQAIAVLNVVLDNGVGGELLFPSETLMTLAKQTIDDAVSALAAEGSF